MSVFEVTAYYAERRVRHSVARVIEYQMGAIDLLVAWEGISLGKPLRLSVERDNLEKLQAVLLAVKFGRLGDSSGSCPTASAACG